MLGDTPRPSHEPGEGDRHPTWRRCVDETSELGQPPAHRCRMVVDDVEHAADRPSPARRPAAFAASAVWMNEKTLSP